MIFAGHQIRDATLVPLGVLKGTNCRTPWKECAILEVEALRGKSRVCGRCRQVSGSKTLVLDRDRRVSDSNTLVRLSLIHI
jgi:hypothetical protein